jgi:hypothetical protein
LRRSFLQDVDHGLINLGQGIGKRNKYDAVNILIVPKEPLRSQLSFFRIRAPASREKLSNRVFGFGMSGNNLGNPWLGYLRAAGRLASRFPPLHRLLMMACAPL